LRGDKIRDGDRKKEIGISAVERCGEVRLIEVDKNRWENIKMYFVEIYFVEIRITYPHYQALIA